MNPQVSEQFQNRCQSFELQKQILKSQENRQYSQMLLKQAIKKQIDRRSKLKKLMEIYSKIQLEQKRHSRLIKCSIIELKDSPIVIKPKLQIDPTIFVINTLKPQFRQFLTMLMNSFYKQYDNNKDNLKGISQATSCLSNVIKQLSRKQNKIFELHGSHLCSLFAQQSQLNLLNMEYKSVTSEQQTVLAEHNKIAVKYNNCRQKHEQKQNKILQLEKYLDELIKKQQNIEENIREQVRLREELWGQFLQQKMYEEKISGAIKDVQREIKCGQKNEKGIFGKLLNCRFQKASSKDKTGKKITMNNSNIQHLKQSRILSSILESKISTNSKQNLFNSSQILKIGECEKNRIKFKTSRQFQRKKHL